MADLHSLGKKNVLIVDDDAAIRSVLAELFEGVGYVVAQASDGETGMDAAMSSDYDLAILDLSLPRVDGLEVLRSIKESKPELPVIVVTGYASMQTALHAMKLGAYDYVTKPFDLDQIQMVAERAAERQRLVDENLYLKNELRERYGFDNVVGMNPSVQQAYVMAAKVADSKASVLILGETGTGKEYLARSVHYHSPRADGPFIKVSCAALPESLLESELFGHEKGAFTGAIGRRIGRFELAHKGTLFLDEIGDVAPSVQVKLLRVLQERQFERVGGSETITSDVRIIAATNRDLRQAIADGAFREDLFYRLNVITISLPPLRERPEDIPELARHFIAKYSADTAKRVDSISPEALEMLRRYSWPGNIRELENCIERAVILCNGQTILPQHLLMSEQPAPNAPVETPVDEAPKTMQQVEKEYIAKVLADCGFNQTKAASILAIDRKTLRNKIRDYGISTEAAD